MACEAISDKEGSVCLRQSVVCLGRSTVEGVVWALIHGSRIGQGTNHQGCPQIIWVLDTQPVCKVTQCPLMNSPHVRFWVNPPLPLSVDILYEWPLGKNAQWAIRPRRERRGQQKVLKLSGSWRPFIQIAAHSGL